MFIVNICLDGDLADPVFPSQNIQKPDTFYFETREDAVKAITQSFHTVYDRMYTFDVKFDKFVKTIDEHFELICTKYRTFCINVTDKNGLNWLYYELTETVPCQLSNGDTCYIAQPTININTEKLDWDAVRKMPDIH